MTGPATSYAQNGEDVVLWRALGHVENGFYVDVGANDPTEDSVTRRFYDAGWTGLNVEPSPDFARRLRDQRDRDVTVEAAVTTVDGEEITLHDVPGTGMSSIHAGPASSAGARGFEITDITVPTRRLDSLVAEHVGDRDVHFCKVDVEGAEAEVLGSVDLTTWRPWVLVVEATEPNSTRPSQDAWEPAVLAAGYELCLFDGLSRFYVASERADELGPALSYPACVLDDFVTFNHLQVLRSRDHLATEFERVHGLYAEQTAKVAELELLRRDLQEWRQRALTAWAGVVSVEATDVPHDARVYMNELELLRNTVSWRVTRPLRAVRRRLGGTG